MHKPWIAFALLAAAIFAAAAAVDSYQHRFVRSDRDLFRFLPQTNATIFFLNVDALRQAGILQLLAGAATTKEADYRAFLRDTRFDYTRDLDAIAGSEANGQIFFVIRGRFDWARLRNYAAEHGGACKNDFCKVLSSTPTRWASFFPIQSNVMALAISGNPAAARSLRGRDEIAPAVPDQLLWVSPSQALLKNPPDLPVALRVFAISLQPAESAVFSLSPAAASGAEQFQLGLDAQCATSVAAQTMRSQLELETKLLKLAFAREHLQSGASDLTNLLISGSFRVSGNRVRGEWPIRRELLSGLQ